MRIVGCEIDYGMGEWIMVENGVIMGKLCYHMLSANVGLS